ncbi:axin-1 [Astyanax mexicanus]|uniref:axin-1 n=1 Tax=Astyanax mexicanus TaxID=7994 RepID=UPI0020CAE9EA|nr:axin-1 [Astyanax mexicanus]XP_022530130.2 axin-1 [Astyanax mexicanus]XP_022530131.2 axin-1 [Astyanax mexicanus]XP_049325301.1 axin-1 [Astyanax mexicanus]
MSVRMRGCHGDLPGRFNEDAPRPPVPGEEDSVGFPSAHSPYPSKLDYSSATPRRSDLDLGFEPEGSASPAPPHLRWAESLHFLLDDQDGTSLFRAFLLQEGCSDLLDFWFACSGFRKLPATDGQDGRRLKLAKAIYRKYIADNSSGVVARKIKPATKTFIRECVCRAQVCRALLDSVLFEQAQVEVQALMEEHTYPLFLKSDVYLAFARRSSADQQSPRLSTSPGNQELPLPGYLPTLMEDKEWAEPVDTGHGPSGKLTQKLLMETAAHRSTPNQKRPDHWEARFGVRELVNPYYVNSGFACAPAASANDSELQSLSSDADTISLTDSSVDGIPPYRFRKQQRRNMQESVKANGHVPLPHIPRTHRLPKDIHVEPQKFAAELISRLELIQRERENQRKLEEKLHRVRMEEECEDADVSTVTSLPGPCLRYHGSSVGQWGEDAQAILDEHLQRVMKSPGCQSPRNPAHAHMDLHRYGNGGRCYSDGAGIMPGANHSNQSEALGYSNSRGNSLSRRSAKGNSDGGRGFDGRGLELPEDAEQKQKILQWMMEGERDSGRYRKSTSSSSVRPGWGGASSDRYDPVPSTSQTEEGRRRSAPQHTKQRLKSSSSRKAACENITVAYYFCGEPIPYMTSVKGRVVTLGQFKELLTKKGSYRFYFKKVSDEFDCGVVYEEVNEDDAVLPIFEERIIGKVEKID